MMSSPTERAHFYKPDQAFARGGAKLSPHVFTEERDSAFAPNAESGWIMLDLSDRLEVPWPCTTPTMLARYGIVQAGDILGSCSLSSGSIVYVLRGSGTTKIADESIAWTAGDAFSLPGGEQAEHVAASASVLFEVSDEPLFHLLGVADSGSTERKTDFAHFQASRIATGLDEVHARHGEQKSAGKCVVFCTPANVQLRLLTPTLLASVNSLEPGGDQRPHFHNSAALTLSVRGESVFSLVNGERIDWMPGAAILTPPGAVHSHHNCGASRMLSFVAQDTGLHTYLQTVGFEWTDADPFKDRKDEKQTSEAQEQEH